MARMLSHPLRNFQALAHQRVTSQIRYGNHEHHSSFLKLPKSITGSPSVRSRACNFPDPLQKPRASLLLTIASHIHYGGFMRPPISVQLPRSVTETYSVTPLACNRHYLNLRSIRVRFSTYRLLRCRPAFSGRTSSAFKSCFKCLEMVLLSHPNSRAISMGDMGTARADMT